MLGRDDKPLPLIFPTSDIYLSLLAGSFFRGLLLCFTRAWQVQQQRGPAVVPGPWAGLGIWQYQSWWQGHHRSGIKTLLLVRVWGTLLRGDKWHIYCVHTQSFSHSKKPLPNCYKSNSPRKTLGGLWTGSICVSFNSSASCLPTSTFIRIVFPS